MPPVVAAVAVAAEAIAAAAATVASIAVTSEIIVSTAVSIGLTFLASLLVAKPSIPDQKRVIRQAIAPRWRYYGKVKTGGIWGFLHARFGVLWQIVMLASHEIDGIEIHYLNEYALTIAGDGNVTVPGFYTENNGSNKLAYLWWQYGTDSDTAFSQLITAFSETYGATDTMLGIAKVLIKLIAEPGDHTPQAYNAGLPVYNAVYRAAKVWDPRDVTQSPTDKSTWKWTWNGVLIVMDYLWHQDGMRLPFSLIMQGIDVWIAQANIADQSVPLKTGGSEARFRLGGGYQLVEPPKSVLPRMLDPMDARLGLRPDGAIVIDTGYWQNPVDTITDAQIVSYSSMSRGRQKKDIRNEFRAQFVDPDYNFVEQDADPWLNEDSIDIDGLQSATLDLTWAPSHRQARVKMKIEAYRQDPQGWCGQIVTNAYGLKFLEPNADGTRKRTMFFEISELAISAAFEIQRFAFDIKTGRCTFTVIELDPAAYDWNPATDEGVAPGLPAAFSPDNIEDPTSLAVTIINQQLNGDTYTAVFQATIDTPQQPDLYPRIQWAIHNDSIADADKVWTNFTIPEYEWTGVSGSLPANTYDIRGFFIASNGAISDYLYERGFIIAYGGGSGGATPTLDFRITGDSGYAVAIGMA